MTRGRTTPPPLTFGSSPVAPKPLLAPATATRGGPRICLVASRPLKDAGRTRRCDVNLLPGGGQEGLLFAFSLLELAVVALRVGHVFAEGDPDERDEDEVGDRDGADGRVGEGRGGCVCPFHPKLLVFMERKQV